MGCFQPVYSRVVGFVQFMISVIGLLLVLGGVALFYSLVFEVYGVKNYKRSCWIPHSKIPCLSVIIGELSSAYSFHLPVINMEINRQKIWVTKMVLQIDGCHFNRLGHRFILDKSYSLRLLIDYSMKSLPNNHIEVKGIPISKQDV